MNKEYYYIRSCRVCGVPFKCFAGTKEAETRRCPTHSLPVIKPPAMSKEEAKLRHRISARKSAWRKGSKKRNLRRAAAKRALARLGPLAPVPHESSQT